MSSNLVFGQANFSGPYCNGLNPSPRASSLCNPSLLAIDSVGDLLVVDGNNRVLEYYQPLTKSKGNQGIGDAIADKVWGQNGSFTTALCNLGSRSPTASSLCGASGVAVDSAFDVFIADGNSRVLEYDHKGKTTGPTTATRVFGQQGFNTAGCNLNSVTTSADGLCSPGGIALDGATDLWVTDRGNNRVLQYLQPLLTQK